MARSSGRAWVGCSGWQYREWRGVGVSGGAAHAALVRPLRDRFSTVELNSTFYRLPSVETVERWREQAPSGFIYAVKLGAFGSHRMKLRDAESWLPNHVDRLERLGRSAGPTLVQLPRTGDGTSEARRVPPCRRPRRIGGPSSCASRHGCTTTSSRCCDGTARRCASTTCSPATPGSRPPTGRMSACTGPTPPTPPTRAGTAHDACTRRRQGRTVARTGPRQLRLLQQRPPGACRGRCDVAVGAARRAQPRLRMVGDAAHCWFGGPVVGSADVVSETSLRGKR